MTPAALRPDGVPVVDGEDAGEDLSERASSVGDAARRNERVRVMLAEHFDFIWRLLRRLGLSEDHSDDAAQQVFVVASKKLDDVPRRSERSFLFGTAMRIASDVRRSAPYRREVPHADPGAELESADRPDDLVEQRRARALLDEVLDGMDLELRSVLVLFEIEEMTTAEIATLLDIPSGTVASRLRRARADFDARLVKLRRGVRETATKRGSEGGGA